MGTIQESLLLQFALHNLLKSYEILLLEKSKKAQDLLFGKHGPLLSKNDGALVKFASHFSSLPFRDAQFQTLNKQLERILQNKTLLDKDVLFLLRYFKKAGNYLLNKSFIFYDENLLFYLLSREFELKALFNTDLLNKRINEIFSNRTEADSWLIERYRLRGYPLSLLTKKLIAHR